MNERVIQYALYEFRTTHQVVVPNIHMRWGESDLLSVARSGYIYDHEIKCSKADFKADFGGAVGEGRRITSIMKYLKHDAFGGGAVRPLPNYFMYVVPVGLLTINDVPSYAGLLLWHAHTAWHAPYGRIEVVKKPPRIHDRKIDQTTMTQLARSLMLRFWAQRQQER